MKLPRAAEKIPELLSPAGNLEIALAAFDGGADAVYCGLGKFNARERAANFSPSDLGRLLRHAGKIGKKVYITFNTLIKDSELPEVMEFLAQLNALAPDALIVQDPGVVFLVRKYFPELVLHASTQMGIHNSAGVRWAANSGFRRVILERQITMEELRRIAACSPLELEVFLHGSLCCSLSGRCLLSASQGGFSGNRGKCRQPCRRMYYSEDGKRFGRFLSPRDLAGVELLPELRRIGVASLKIEGRLRSPDYVWKTARAYRILLDGPVVPEPERLLEAEKWLAAAASRRPSRGFFFLDRNLIDADRPGSFGSEVAVVEKTSARGIFLRSVGRLHLGDRLRGTPPNGGDGDSFSLIKLEKDGAFPVRLNPGERAFVPGNFSLPPDSTLFKIGENSFDYSRQAASLPPAGRNFDLKLRASASRWSAEIPGIPGWKWEKNTAFPPAEKQPLSDERICSVFGEGAPDGWIVRRVSVTLDGRFFVPASVLKSLRRECFAALEKLSISALPDPSALALMKFFQDSHCGESPAPTGAELPPPGQIFVPDPFTPELMLEDLRREILAAFSAGIRNFAASAPHHLELFRQLSGIRVFVLFPFPVCNRAAASLLRDSGVFAVEPEFELSADDIAALAVHSPLPLLPRAHREIPLLVSRAVLPELRFREKNGVLYEVRRNRVNRLFELFAPDVSIGML